jgi:hypothetical protein
VSDNDEQDPFGDWAEAAARDEALTERLRTDYRYRRTLLDAAADKDILDMTGEEFMAFIADQDDRHANDFYDRRP